MFEQQNFFPAAILLAHAACGLLQGYGGGAVIRLVTGWSPALIGRLSVHPRTGRPRPRAARGLAETMVYSLAGALGILLTMAPAYLVFYFQLLPRHRHGFAVWMSALAAGLTFYAFVHRRR